MMDKRLEKAINQQINVELAASYTYLAMAAYFDRQHLDGFGAFMQRQSDEEQVHAHRLFRYLLDRGAEVSLDAIPKPPAKFGSIEEVFRKSLEQEKANTKAIYELYDMAREIKDYATLAHLQWFLDEQVEEEKLMTDILGRLELAGEDKSAMLILDVETSKRGLGTGAKPGAK